MFYLPAAGAAKVENFLAEIVIPARGHERIAWCAMATICSSPLAPQALGPSAQSAAHVGMRDTLGFAFCRDFCK
ncbi:hypothetical protein [Bordetella sp. FB-8]|uniref:hypothetical protein n=1 Tax=Bordetella sp. FB-8 TaxID=1159870 RepID=UPI0012DDD433|nr:hypothetical protein [Bordetella sp. FB-8]